jgi:succinylglutamate desuccinylase
VVLIVRSKLTNAEEPPQDLSPFLQKSLARTHFVLDFHTTVMYIMSRGGLRT